MMSLQMTKKPENVVGAVVSDLDKNWVPGLASTESGDVASKVDDCKNALKNTRRYSSSYYSTNEIEIDDGFYRVIEESLIGGDDVTTELVYKMCVKHIDTITYLGVVTKPDDWAINRAAEYGAEKSFKMLVENGANVNAEDKRNYGITPLHWVARNSGTLRGEYNPKKEYLNIADILFANNANISAENDSGYTPLHSGAKTGAQDIVRSLIEKGANVNKISKHGYTPLHMTGEFNKVDVAKLLIQNGAELEIKNDDGLTPLAFSAVCATKDVLKVLIDSGANKNTQDNNGNTALHLIAKYRKGNRSYYADAVQFLVDNNIDKNIKNNDGKTACDLAKETEKTLLIPILGCEA
ncbi:Ankyrin-3 [Pseudolycoriella hygida]|uniref:Ankyrin-3 n=1 Tax=Pseudolycoriella hygida TaxID=35572 RepID=A0A9Q0MR71_9DIPT|nr:Ankyrin-3 [Pseudolycoriella hygida]